MQEGVVNTSVYLCKPRSVVSEINTILISEDIKNKKSKLEIIKFLNTRLMMAVKFKFYSADKYKF